MFKLTDKNNIFDKIIPIVDSGAIEASQSEEIVFYALWLTTTTSKDKDKAEKEVINFRDTFVKAMKKQSNPEESTVLKHVVDYLKWSMPYQFYDTYTDDTDIKRDERKEKIITAELKQLLINLQVAE